MSSISSLLSGNPKLGGVLGSNNGSEASERLYVTRPSYSSSDSTNRGQHAYIRLLTSSEQTSAYQSYSSKRTSGGNQCDSSTLANALFTMSGAEGSGYDKFLLTGVSASLEEKLQVVEVFGDTEVAYYFGRAPMMFSLSGILIDSQDNPWFSNWLETYAGALRGTELAKNYELLKIVLPNMTIVGSIVSCRWDQQSANEVAVPFSIQFLAKAMLPTPVGGVGQPMTNAANLINFASAGSYTSQSGINSLKNKIAALTNGVKSPLSSIASLSSLSSKVGGSLPGTPSAVSKAIDGITGMASSGLSDLRSLFKPLIGTMEGVRASLFSPVYGVMNSLTKLVKTVFGANGLSSIFSSLTAPIRNILGDITRISNQATALVNMVTGGISGLGRGFATGFGITQSYSQAVKAFKRAAGTIASAPTTISNSIGYLINGGRMSSQAAFLNPAVKQSLSRSANLPSRNATANTGIASLSSSRGLSSRAALLRGNTGSLSTVIATL